PRPSRSSACCASSASCSIGRTPRARPKRCSATRSSSRTSASSPSWSWASSISDEAAPRTARSLRAARKNLVGSSRVQAAEPRIRALARDMHSRPPLRIATRTMLAFAAFALFCVGLTAAVLLEEAHDGMVEAIVERQRLLTENRAMMLHDNLALALGELSRLSHMAEIDLEDGDPRPEQRLLAQAFRQSPFFNRSVQLVGPQGLCHFDEPGRPSCVGRDLSRERWFAAAQGSSDPSAFFVAEPDGTGQVNLVVPIKRED